MSWLPISPPFVPEGTLLPTIEWKEYKNTRYGFTLKNPQDGLHRIITDEQYQITDDPSAVGMLVELEPSSNPNKLGISGGSLPPCALPDPRLAGLTFEKQVEQIPIFPDTARRSKVIPVTAGERSGYGLVVRSGYVQCGGSHIYIDEVQLAENEIVYLFFKTSDGYVSIDYPRDSQMAQTIVSTFKFVADSE
ncbi:MAG: hypothetical protein KDB27_02040 [Planctomycetales bacterium]|nr:hypothetical protein [Planctomycetales bacterium]